jgi:hypothetical protein
VDERLVEGPIPERNRTDVFFLYGFLLILLLFLISFFVTMSIGNKRALFPVFDSSARACGYNEETRDYPYIYFTI